MNLHPPKQPHLLRRPQTFKVLRSKSKWLNKKDRSLHRLHLVIINNKRTRWHLLRKPIRANYLSNNRINKTMQIKTRRRILRHRPVRNRIMYQNRDQTRHLAKTCARTGTGKSSRLQKNNSINKKESNRWFLTKTSYWRSAISISIQIGQRSRGGLMRLTSFIRIARVSRSINFKNK